MKIRRISAITGVERTKDIPLNPDDWVKYKMGYNLDDALPYLSDADRDFILSGITPEEWKVAFVTQEEE